MDADYVRAYFNRRYPGKDVVPLPPHKPTEMICEIERTVDPDQSVAIAFIERSEPHCHDVITEVYYVLKGHLDVYVDGQRHLVRQGHELTISPGQVHWAKGYEGAPGHFTRVRVTSTPAWEMKYHHLVTEKK